MNERLSARLASRLRAIRRIAPFLAAVFLAGCASRRPVATAPPSPPAQPESVPPPAAPAPPSGPSAPQPPTRPSPFIPGVFVQEGTASWYGFPFHGRRAADGEIFDMDSLVAAHRTLPFGSVVRVTNLNNGREVQVRVIDRGPFVGDRILDLAHAAAVALDMIGTGTAPVRIELLSEPNPAVGDFTVQIGAFSDRGNAERLRDRLLARYQPIVIQEFATAGGRFYRVRVGKVPDPDAAQQIADELKASDGFKTFVIRLDEPTELGIH